MINLRINAKERGLLKGAVRRVFSRSDLRREALARATVENITIAERPRVKKWGKCTLCTELVPLYLMVVDHIEPVVPIHISLDQMNWDDLINRVWCDIIGLQALCEECHKAKTKLENAERRKIKKEKKDVESSKGTKRAAKAVSKGNPNRGASKGCRRKTD